MSNIKQWLENAEAKFNDPIESIVVGKHYDVDYYDLVKADENIVLTREQGLAKVDLEFDSGFGGADCFPIYAWTQNRVFWIAEYDGATHLASMPRYPQDCEPNFSGEDTEW